MFMRTRINLIAICVAALLGCFCFSAQAAAIDWNLKTECVGRYQISVPVDSEYPVASYKELNNGDNPAYRFNDGLRVSQEIKYDGYVQVGDGSRQDDFELLKAVIEKDANTIKNDLLSIDHKEDAAHITTVPIAIPNAFAWRYRDAIHLHMLRDGYIFHWGVGGKPGEFSTNLKKMQDFIAGFRLRSMFDIPTANGVCFPFGFVADNGETFRDVTVSFRPKSHPDVVITFEDNLAEWNDPNANQKYLLARLFEPHFKNATLDVIYRDFHTKKIDGREGVAGFSNLHRKNGQKDYLYIALVTGTEKTGKDTPTLMLRMERIAEYAKGQPPISKSEFKALAEDVLNSIHRKPVESHK